jgi:hypothetical protein
MRAVDSGLQPLEGLANMSGHRDGHHPHEGVVTSNQMVDGRQQRSNGSENRHLLGEKLLTYDAFLMASGRDLQQKNLLESYVLSKPDLGNFLSMGDGRLMGAKLEMSLGQKQGKLFSFTLSDLKCT